MSNFLLLISSIMFMIGIKMIFDARPIVRMYFRFGNENEATLGMKILGYVFAIISSVVILIVMN